jgi:hypothetical protein
MGRADLQPWARRLLLCLGADVKSSPRRYSEAGKWLDTFHDVEQFWQRRRQELRRLRISQSEETSGTEKFKVEYLELMIELEVYVPFDSFEFWMMVQDIKERPRETVKPKANKKIERLLSARDLGEEGFTRWAFENVPEYRDSNLSLTGFAFVMQNVIKEGMRSSDIPSIANLRDGLSRWGMIMKEPALCYRFKDALDDLFWRCSARDIMSMEDAANVALVMWLLSDPAAEGGGLGITKFEKWSWDRGTIARCNVYYETFFWNLECTKVWLDLAMKAHEILSIAGEFPESAKSKNWRSARGKDENQIWHPPEGYIGAKSIAQEYHVPRTTLEGWQKRGQAGGRLKAVVKDPQTGENYYPVTWFEEQLKTYRARKPNEETNTAPARMLRHLPRA